MNRFMLEDSILNGTTLDKKAETLRTALNTTRFNNASFCPSTGTIVTLRATRGGAASPSPKRGSVKTESVLPKQIPNADTDFHRAHILKSRQISDPPSGETLKSIEEAACDRAARSAAEILKRFGEGSSVFRLMSEYHERPHIFEGMLIAHCMPARAATLEAHLFRIHRLMRDLEACGRDPLVWSVKDVFAIFLWRSSNGSARKLTFSSILSSIRYFSNLFGIESCSNEQGNVILIKFIATWEKRLSKATRRAPAIPPTILAKIEAVVTSRLDFPLGALWSEGEIVWAWVIRLFAGAGIRWSDGLYTPPSTAVVSENGLTACATHAKNFSSADGRPWSCSDVALHSKNWLKTGWSFFSSLPDHSLRDFWIGRPSGDFSTFSHSPCTFFDIQRVMAHIFEKIGIEKSLARNFRPHSFKASLLSPAVSLLATSNQLSETEIMLLGQWRPDTSKNMALVYSRENQNVQLSASAKVMRSLKESLDSGCMSFPFRRGDEDPRDPLDGSSSCPDSEIDLATEIAGPRLPRFSGTVEPAHGANRLSELEGSTGVEGTTPRLACEPPPGLEDISPRLACEPRPLLSKWKASSPKASRDVHRAPQGSQLHTERTHTGPWSTDRSFPTSIQSPAASLLLSGELARSEHPHRQGCDEDFNRPSDMLPDSVPLCDPLLATGYTSASRSQDRRGEVHASPKPPSKPRKKMRTCQPFRAQPSEAPLPHSGPIFSDTQRSDSGSLDATPKSRPNSNRGLKNSIAKELQKCLASNPGKSQPVHSLGPGLRRGKSSPLVSVKRALEEQASRST